MFCFKKVFFCNFINSYNPIRKNNVTLLFLNAILF